MDIHHRLWVLLLLLAGFVANAAFSERTVCRNTTLASNTEKTCYSFYDNPSTWSDALNDCAGRDSKLVIIQDEATQNFLDQEMIDLGWTGNNIDFAWMGLRLNISDNFTWYSGADVVYTDWGTDQPDYDDDSKICTSMRVGEDSARYNWTAERCAYQKMSYVCQNNISQVDCTTNTSSIVELEYDTLCYRITFLAASESTSWTEARLECEQWNGGTLAEIHTEGLRLELEKQMELNRGEIGQHHMAGFWIGLIRGQWNWYDGSKVTYENWAGNEPGGEGCSRINNANPSSDPADADMKWFAGSCSKLSYYICQTTENCSFSTEGPEVTTDLISQTSLSFRDPGSTKPPLPSQPSGGTESSTLPSFPAETSESSASSPTVSDQSVSDSSNSGSTPPISDSPTLDTLVSDSSVSNLPISDTSVPNLSVVNTTASDPVTQSSSDLGASVSHSLVADFSSPGSSATNEFVSDSSFSEDLSSNTHLLNTHPSPSASSSGSSVSDPSLLTSTDTDSSTSKSFEYDMSSVSGLVSGTTNKENTDTDSSIGGGGELSTSVTSRGTVSPPSESTDAYTASLKTDIPSSVVTLEKATTQDDVSSTDASHVSRDQTTPITFSSIDDVTSISHVHSPAPVTVPSALATPSTPRGTTSSHALESSATQITDRSDTTTVSSFTGSVDTTLDMHSLYSTQSTVGINTVTGDLTDATGPEATGTKMSSSSSLSSLLTSSALYTGTAVTDSSSSSTTSSSSSSQTSSTFETGTAVTNSYSTTPSSSLTSSDPLTGAAVTSSSSSSSSSSFSSSSSSSVTSSDPLTGTAVTSSSSSSLTSSDPQTGTAVSVTSPSEATKTSPATTVTGTPGDGVTEIQSSTTIGSHGTTSSQKPPDGVTDMTSQGDQVTGELPEGTTGDGGGGSTGLTDAAIAALAIVLALLLIVIILLLCWLCRNKKKKKTETTTYTDFGQQEPVPNNDGNFYYTGTSLGGRTVTVPPGSNESTDLGIANPVFGIADHDCDNVLFSNPPTANGTSDSGRGSMDDVIYAKPIKKAHVNKHVSFYDIDSKLGAGSRAPDLKRQNLQNMNNVSVVYNDGDIELDPLPNGHVANGDVGHVPVALPGEETYGPSVIDDTKFVTTIYLK